MKILVACEFSGIVRSAFAALGHDAWSCDILPTEIPGQHIMDDVRNVLDAGWDLMIAHPPCTYLTIAGNRSMKPEYAHLHPDRMWQRQQAIWFVKELWNAPIPHIAIENPVGVLASYWRQSDQTIHPYWFGHSEKKATCLWLKNLPLLRPSQIVKPQYAITEDGSTFYDSRGFRDSPTHYRTAGMPRELRAKERSRTYNGIAQAMAAQWSKPLCVQIDLFSLKTA